MQEKVCNLGGYDELKTIGGIEFTTREIDIISCVLSGWSAHKSIAAFLTTPSQTISPRTIETHLRNIIRKMGCLSQSGIIDYIENADKRSAVQNHYRYLQTHINFERKLTELYRYLAPKQLCVVYEANQENLLLVLLRHFELAGIKAIKNEDKTKDINLNSAGYYHYLYIVSKELINQFESDKTEKKLAISKQSQQALTGKQDLTFLLLDNTISPIPEEFSKVGIINMLGQEKYHVLFFELLQRIDPILDLKQTILEFKKDLANQKFDKNNPQTAETTYFSFIRAVFGKNKKQWIIPLITTSAALLYLIDWVLDHHKITILQHPTQTSIHSNLLVPLGKNILQRPQLMKQIETYLGVEKGIRIVALVGIGGAGKTTLSRQYAMQQKENFIWEVNAETVSTLFYSFEKMAFALCQTEEDHNTLRSLKAIQNVAEREEKILAFAKNKLKSIPNWLLIYDNVEKIADIQEYIPTNMHAWGNGRAILTTRDHHIQQNIYIHNTIFIDKLTPQEKFELFAKITNVEQNNYVTKKKEIKQFLEKIDSFPLDVSVAAFYLKATGINYDQYLKELSHYTPDFTALQEQVLKDATHYIATRHSIVCLSIDKILKTHKDFGELILLISTIDSQNIPRALLESTKDKVVVDNLIYCLKKYSLITDFSGGKSLEATTFSLHRSVQSLLRHFLLELLSEEENRVFLAHVVSSIESFYNFYTDGDHSLILLLIPHLEELVANLKTITLSNPLKEQFLQRLYLVLGYAYKRCSRNLILEKKYFSQAYEMQIRTNSLPIQKLAILLKDLGSTCIDMREPDEAITYTQKSIELCQQIPNSTILTADNFQIMGYAYTEKNDSKNAEFFFKKALKVISQAPSDDLKKESESDIYAMLGWLYSTIYIHGQKTHESISYVKKALELVKGDCLFYKNPSKPHKAISRYIARHRTTLGEIYCRAGKYEEAFNEGFKEAQYIIDHSLDNSPHYLLRVYIAIGMGEIYLRQQKVKLAKNKLMESIRDAKKLMGENTSLILSPMVLCIEAKIRLGELAEAYEDCLAAFKIERKSKTNYSDLFILIAHYHAAIIKYKQGDFKKAMSYFCDFFRESRAFCKHFLDSNTYRNLEEEKTFDSELYQGNSSLHNVKECLQRSTKIFSAIYGHSHPFVQNYVAINMLG